MPPENSEKNLPTQTPTSNASPAPVPVFTATPSSGIKTMPTSPEEARRPATQSPATPQPQQISDTSVPPATNPNFIPPSRTPEPSPIPTQPTIPVPPPTPRPAPRPFIPQTPASYREPILESDKTPFQPVIAPVLEKKVEPVQEKNPAIRTLQGDIAETVQGRGLSIADIALAEQKRRGDSSEPRPKEKSETNWWVVGTVLFLLLTTGVISAIIYLRPNTEAPLIEEPLSTSSFPVDTKETLNVTSMTFDGFTREIKTRLLGDLNLGTIQTIDLIQESNLEPGATAQIKSEQFFSLIKSRAPSRLIRSLQDRVVFGIATVDKPTSFVMFSTSVFETAFAGMLEWEDSMLEDLPFITKSIPPPTPPPLFEIVATSTSTSTDVASTTTTTPPPPALPQEQPKAVFKDIVVQNKDARAATLPDGTIRLLYSFPDKNTLIIAQNKEALTLILQRLSTARFTR